MPFDHQMFSWGRVHDLFGVPYREARVQQLFFRAGLNPDEAWRESRVGIYTMAPHDKQPCPVAAIDLIPSYRVRFLFKHASLVAGAATVHPTTFVFAAVTYYLDTDEGREPFLGALPEGIRPTDDLGKVLERVGKPPTGEQWQEGKSFGHVRWEDRNPTLHVLFNRPVKRPLRVNVFLAPNDAAVGSVGPLQLH